MHAIGTGLLISIHALRVEGDGDHTVFQRGPVRISIHALRVEGDVVALKKVIQYIYFYPRPPGGGRLSSTVFLAKSTHISIHALRVEGDHYWLWYLISQLYFYPRPPGGGRPPEKVFPFSGTYFYPRPPGGGRPSSSVRLSKWSKFLSTPSGWRATAKTDKVFICFCAKGRRICLFKTREEKICRWRFKKDKFWVLIWCEGSGKSVCASASHCG